MSAASLSAARPSTGLFSAVTRHWWVAAGLFLLAAAVRLYRLGADPLWLDEIISTDLARSPLAVILANSLSDPHPPLYYLLLRLTSGFGAAQAEWAWRLPSALAGALSVPALYMLARRTLASVTTALGDWPAALVAVWLAVLPTPVYFSQEARWPAVTLLLVLLLTIVFVDLLAQPANRRCWVLYAALALLALFTSYSALLVVGLQVLVVLWAVRRQPGALWLALALLGSLALQIGLAAGTLPRIAAEHLTSRPLRLDDLLQSLLAGDVFRYGTFWAHKFVVGPLLLLAALGAWRVWRTAAGPHRFYASLQVAAPLVAYGLVAQPLLHLNLPTFETRQFLVLLPALLLLLAQGLAQLAAWLPRWAGWGAALAFTALVLAGSGQGLARYWSITRSPEGYAAQAVAARLQPGDGLVALDYFSKAALRYYLPKPPAYVDPHIGSGQLVFLEAPDSLTRLNQDFWGPDIWPAVFSLEAVQAHPRLWVFSVPGRFEDYLPDILAGCQIVETLTFEPTPIRVQLVTACPAPAP